MSFRLASGAWHRARRETQDDASHRRKDNDHGENAESPERANPSLGEAGPLHEGAAERSEAGGVSHAEGAESESHAENAETAEL